MMKYLVVLQPLNRVFLYMVNRCYAYYCDGQFSVYSLYSERCHGNDGDGQFSGHFI